MHRLSLYLLLGVVVVDASACDEKGDGDGSETQSPTSGETSTPTATSGEASTSSSTEDLDGDAFCAQFTTQDDCPLDAMVGCGWRELTTYDQSCGEVATQGLCLWIPTQGTDPGCVVPPQCPGQAFYRDVEGGVEVSWECGGSFPAGFEPCPRSDSETYAIAECNCGCTLGGSSSDGGNVSDTEEQADTDTDR